MTDMYKSYESSIEKILLPGTPHLIKEAYLSLTQRASQLFFEPLENDFIVLDTETTGLSFRNCELIEIAAARINNGKISDRFQTFVHPTKAIPSEIVQLTGITQEDVEYAPDVQTAVHDLALFVAGDPVLAHNAVFDRTFIEKVPGGHEVSDNWIDTLSLSRIALPRLKTHRLSDMAAAFGCNSVTHRACDDVEALVGMWHLILCALSDMPSGLLSLFADMHPELPWTFRPIFSYLAHEWKQQEEAFSLKQCRKELVSSLDLEQKNDARDKEEPYLPLDVNKIQQAFLQDGLVGSLYKHYESRPDQNKMAQCVSRALNSSTHRSIEAGTGVGKSMAYLLPSVLFAQKNNITVGIATKTNALTDQLISHELPALDHALPQGVKFMSLKGYDHYPCLYKLERAALAQTDIQVEDNEPLSETAAHDVLVALAVTYAFCSQSPEGDLDALGIRWRNVPRSTLTTTATECLKNQCPFYPHECLVHGARRRAAASDIVVTNHSLLLKDVVLDGAILPPIRHWVIDEAHSFESEARQQWALEVSNEATRRSFESLGDRKSGLIHTLLINTSSLDGKMLYQRLLTKCSTAISRASLSCSELFEALHDLQRLTQQNASYAQQNLWINDKVRLTKPWQSFMDVAKLCQERLEEAHKSIQDTSEALTQEAPQLSAQLSKGSRFITELLEALKVISKGEDTSYVYSAQISSRIRDIASERLIAEKVDIGEDLSSSWLPELETAIFCSATIAIANNFEHFNHAIGFDRLAPAQHEDLRLQSNFNYQKNMAVFVTQDMPQPNDQAYIKKLVSTLFDIHVTMGGSVLSLFTNRNDMEQVYESLAPKLETAGLKLMYQERGASIQRLQERFTRDTSSSLLALRSFWEGIDSPGDTLRCVVIPKLPFSSPTNPLAQERELRDSRAWWHHSLPEAVIAVKQAAGRLIRNELDKGVLILADSRLVTKRYGKTFISSLPNPQAQFISCADISEALSTWLQEKERDETKRK